MFLWPPPKIGKYFFKTLKYTKKMTNKIMQAHIYQRNKKVQFGQ
jgi:hypothetical protein